MIRKAMILAAGRGSRLGGLTDELPKPMLRVAGVPLLEHTIRALVRCGIEDAVINLHHHPEPLMEYFGDGARFGLRLHYSREEELLGTAGAVKKVAPFFQGAPFLVHYGDNLTTIDLGRLAAAHAASGATVTLALFWKEDVMPHSAVELTDDLHVVRFVEKPRAEEAPSHWISAGVFIIEPKALEYVAEAAVSDFGFDLFPALLAASKPMQGYCMHAPEQLWWIDTLDAYDRTCAVWARAVAAEKS